MDFFPPQISKSANLRNLVTSATRLESRLNRINEERYIVDYLFNTSPAEGGGVVYERNTSRNILDREAQAIDDGAEFPKLNSGNPEMLVDRVKRYGGEVDLTFASVRRNNTNDYKRKVQQLANTVLAKTNAIAVKAVMGDAEIPTYSAAAAWTSDTANPLADLMTAQFMIDDSNRGFTSNVALINPQDALALRVRKDIRDALPRETKELSPVLTRELSGLIDLEWIKSPYVEHGTVVIADRNSLGAVGDEEGGLKADTYDLKERHVHVLQAWRTIAPVIQEPLAAVKITGVK